jgi:hypothetical protein
VGEIESDKRHSEADEAIHQSDLSGIRSAVQWLLGAFGGIALAVVAGVQFGGAPAILSQGGPRALVIIVGLLVVFIGLVWLARSAARVLVPDRTNLTDLLENQVSEELRLNGLSVSGNTRRDSAQVYKYVREEINRARGWILPPGCDDLDSAYQAYRKRSTNDQAALRSSFREIMAFARAEAALYRYRQLLKQLLGWVGIPVILGLVALAFALTPSAEQHPSASVNSPFAVEVHFTASPEVLSNEGIAANCASKAAKGIAVGGTLAEPEVVIVGTSSCPTSKIQITSNIGFAMPLLP